MLTSPAAAHTQAWPHTWCQSWTRCLGALAQGLSHGGQLDLPDLLQGARVPAWWPGPGGSERAAGRRAWAGQGAGRRPPRSLVPCPSPAGPGVPPVAQGRGCITRANPAVGWAGSEASVRALGTPAPECPLSGTVARQGVFHPGRAQGEPAWGGVPRVQQPWVVLCGHHGDRRERREVPRPGGGPARACGFTGPGTGCQGLHLRAVPQWPPGGRQVAAGRAACF